MNSPPTPPNPLPWDGRALSTLLPLQEIGVDRFASIASDDNFNRRIYGGQLLGQAVLAAGHTAETDRGLHMLQANFCRGAAVDRPLVYQVQRLLDGRRYSTRHVRVTQDENVVLDAQVSFTVELNEPPIRQIDADPVPEPEQLHGMTDLIRQVMDELGAQTIPLIDKHCVEMRPVEPEGFMAVPNAQPRMRYWLRLREGVPDPGRMHESALAFLSDYFITLCSYAVYVPMVRMRDFYTASLNHGLWVHQGFRSDDWLLFDCESPATGFGRGFATVKIYDRAKRLLASACQQIAISQRL